MIIAGAVLTASGAAAPAGGALAAGGTAILTAGASQVSAADDYEKASKVSKDNAKRAYLDTVGSMINLLQYKQREAQINAYQASKSTNV